MEVPRPAAAAADSFFASAVEALAYSQYSDDMGDRAGVPPFEEQVAVDDAVLDVRGTRGPIERRCSRQYVDEEGRRYVILNEAEGNRLLITRSVGASSSLLPVPGETVVLTPSPHTAIDRKGAASITIVIGHYESFSRRASSSSSEPRSAIAVVDFVGEEV